MSIPYHPTIVARILLVGRDCWNFLEKTSNWVGDPPSELTTPNRQGTMYLLPGCVERTMLEELRVTWCRAICLVQIFSLLKVSISLLCRLVWSAGLFVLEAIRQGSLLRFLPPGSHVVWRWHEPLWNCRRVKTPGAVLASFRFLLFRNCLLT